MSWQQTAIEQFTALLAPNEDVLALIWGGSSVRGVQDQWSDLDVLIVIRETTLDRFFPSFDWLRPFGEIFAYEQYSKPFKWVTRVCFYDFHRFDISITTEANLMHIEHGPDYQIVFSHLPGLPQIMSQITRIYTPPAFSDEQFEELAAQFWFKAVMAVTKQGRGDEVIAQHLCLDLMRDCLVLAMLLRDRDGGDWNHITEPINLLEHAAQSARLFDHLALLWSPDYHPRSEQFCTWSTDSKKTGSVV